MLLLEGRIPGPPFKEVGEGAVQMPQGLLWGDGRDLVQPGGRFLLLEAGQGGRGVTVEERCTALAVGIPAQSKSPVIDETRTTDRSGPASDAGSVWDSSDSGRRVGASYQRLLFHPGTSGKRSQGRLPPDRLKAMGLRRPFSMNAKIVGAFGSRTRGI